MSGRLNLVGDKFCRLTVLSAGVVRNGNVHWLCRCECGAELVVSGGSLRSQNTKSCGCLRVETTGRNKTTHGRSGSPEHTTWTQMIQRCRNPGNHAFDRYGGRGISVCDRWRTSFAAFIDDMGPRPSADHSIDRINNDGDYEKANCRWSTRTVQGRNKRSNRRLLIGGETRVLAEWAERSGLTESVIDARLRRGWTGERLLSAVRPCRRRTV